MSRWYLVFCTLALAVSANAQNLVVDDFESYSDDVALEDAWPFSKAGGPDGLWAYLDTANDPPQGTQCLLMDVYMAEKWWHNIIRKDIPGGPINLADYLSLSFQFYGDPNADSVNLSFNVFLYDSVGRVLTFTVPAANLTNASWQKISLSLSSFAEEEWDAGYGTDAPDADKTDIVSVGLMVVGNEDDLAGLFYVDDIQLKAKTQNLSGDNFDSYADDAALNEVWSYSKAGGPDALTASLDKSNTPPDGSQCLLMDINMPEKWWYNTLSKTLDTALDLSQYSAISFWFYGDADVVPNQLSFTVFLYDSQNRILRYSLPSDNVTTPSWQKITLSLSSFSQEEWDSGHDTDTPDADSKDINSIGLMVVGDEVNQVAQFYVDDIQFVSKVDSATVTGTMSEDGLPLAGVTVLAIEQNSVQQTLTDDAGVYTFDQLEQGVQYRILPIFKGYDFTPGYEMVTLLNASYTEDFAGAPSIYNSLEKTEIVDNFDESGLNPDIVYRGAREWGQDEVGNTRPIIDVTQDKAFTVNFPDSTEGEAYTFAIPEDNLSGAASPKFSVEIGGFYSWDMLAFGQNTDANYYVETDTWCDVRYDTAEGSYDRVSLGLHCSFSDPDKPALDAYSNSNFNYSSGGYALTFESDTGDITARKYASNNDKAKVQKRVEGFATEYGKVTLADSGWHRLRIEYLNGQITFIVDGESIATVTDADYPYGPAGLHYRGCYTDALSDLEYMSHARFNDVKAGPTAPSAVEMWMLN